MMFPFPSPLYLMLSNSVPSTLPPRPSGDNEQEVEKASSGESEQEVEEVSSGSSKQGCDEVCSNEDGKEAIENSEQIVEKPKVGVIFDTQDEAYRYYLRYAQQMGFAVARSNLRKGKDGNVRHVCFECNCCGKAKVKTSNPVKPRPQTKCGRARLNLSTNPDGKWKINWVVLEHNHENSSGKARFRKNYRVLNEHVKKKLLMNDKAGIKTYKTYDSLQIEAGGPEKLPYLPKDCRNYVDNERHKLLVVKEMLRQCIAM